MYTFSIGKGILNEYIVDSQIRKDHFAEYYRVTSNVEDKSYDLVMFAIEKGSIYERDFSRFCQIIEKLYENDFKHLLKPAKLFIHDYNELNLNTCILLYEAGALEKTLAEKIDWDDTRFSGKTLSLDELKKIVKAVAPALLELYDHNRSHSYISPEYIFIRNGKYKLGLPALAHLIEEVEQNNLKSITKAQSDLNAFPLAPEGIESRNALDKRSDIWSLGVLVATISGGRLPFFFETEREYLAEIRSRSLKLDMGPVPKYLRRIVARCLELVPSERLAVEQLLEKLEELQDSWLCPQCGENNSFSNNVCEKCGAEYISSSTQAEIQHSGWYEITYDTSKMTLEESDSRLPIQIAIQPLQIPKDIRASSIGATLALSVKANEIGGSKKHTIDILPKPYFQFYESKSYIHKFMDRGKSEFVGEVFFALKKSKVFFKNVLIDINKGEEKLDASARESTIQFQQLHRVVTAGSEELCIRFTLSEIPIDKPVPIQIIFDLFNRQQYVHDLILTPRFPAQLRINGQLDKLLTAYAGQHKKVELKLENIGGSDVNLKEILLQPSHPFLRVEMPAFRRIDPDNAVSFALHIDGAGQKATAHPVQIRVLYTERMPNGQVQEKEIVLETVVKIEPLGQLDFLAIDFGTTNTCAAYRDKTGQSKAISLENLIEPELDPYSIPSIAYYNSKNSLPIIGKNAKDALNNLLPNVIYSSKRFIGVQKELVLTFKDNSHAVKMYEDIVKDFIQRILDEITNEVGGTFDSYVFTYPTNFDTKTKKRYETILKSVCPNKECKLYDEASAAALNYASNSKNNASDEDQEKWILVYDFGGGTTDIAFAHYRSEQADGFFGDKTYFEPVKSTGHERFGGDDITLAVIELIRQAIEKEYKKIVPFMSAQVPELSDVSHFSDEGFEVVARNSTALWNIAEYFKINLAKFDGNEFSFQFQDREQFVSLTTIDSGRLNQPKSWQMFETGELEQAEIEKIDWLQLRKELFKMVYTILDQIIRSALDIIRPYAEEQKPIIIALLGKSSQFPLVRDLFEFYLFPEGNGFDHDFYGFAPDPGYAFPKTHNCILELPQNAEDLKSVVAKGAIDLEMRQIGQKKDLLVFDVGFPRGNGDFRAIIASGTQKLPANEPIDKVFERIDLGHKDTENAALYLSNSTSLKSEVYNTFYKKTMSTGAQSLGNIRQRIEEHFIGKQGQIMLYVDADDKIHWALRVFHEPSGYQIIGSGALNEEA